MSENVAALLGLEQQLRQAADPAQLFYTLVNQTERCVSYGQAVLLVGERLAHARVVAASDIPSVDYTSPFVEWVERLASALISGEDPLSVRTPGVDELPGAVSADWAAMAPEHLLWIPLKVAARDGEAIGVLLLFRDSPWSDAEQGLCEHLAGSMAHALFALRRCHPLRRFWQGMRRRRVVAVVALLAAALLWLPVRLSALSPLEVIPQDPLVISAPMDGVVRQVTVEPNQVVAAGDLLVQLEDNELTSERAVAQQALLVSQAELKTAQQGGFMDPTQKARVAELEARVRMRQSEVEYVRGRLERAAIHAPGDGIAVLGDPNAWKGRPVRVGERIMLVADAARVELEILLPVKDSIALREGAEVRVFFDNDPLHAWSARIRHAGYEPQRTLEDQLAYRLVASLEERGEAGRGQPRIGMRGTAKVYGEPVSLFFYLFRRPITSARQWLGW